MGIYEFDAEEFERVVRRESWEDGLAEGLEKGAARNLIQQVCRKLVKGKPVDVIAEELEEDPEIIRKICAIAEKYAPNYDAEKIAEDYLIQDTSFLFHQVHTSHKDG